MDHLNLPWMTLKYHSTHNVDGALICQKAKQGNVIIELFESPERSAEECDTLAEFIVKACNSHEALLGACKAVRRKHWLNRENE